MVDWPVETKVPDRPSTIGFENLAEKILRIARTRIDKFELGLLAALREHLHLIACSCYSLNPYANTLSLRGQTGLSYDAYKSFSLDIRSAAGKAFSSPHAQLFSDLSRRADYRDKSLIHRFGLDRMIVLPIHYRGRNERRPVCSICLYPRPEARADELITIVNGIQFLIEAAFEFSLDFTAHLLRKQLVDRAIHRSDASSFLFRMLQVLKEDWNFEAGSVFLFDKRAICLRLAATTGLTVRGLEKRDVFYRLTEIQHQTVRSFVDQKQLAIELSQVTAIPPRYREKVNHSYRSAIVTPYFAPEQTRRTENRPEDNCLGVIRLVNRQIIHDDHVETADFTWEDIEVINFLCDVVGVVTHLYQRVAQKSADFERIVHGLETSILTITGALHNVNDNVDCAAVFPSFLAHSIPNAIAFAESMHEQVRVFKMRDVQQIPKPQFQAVKLVGDIISVIPRFAQNSANFFGVETVVVDRSTFYRSEEKARSDGERIRPVPAVYTDQNLLLAVFKNLVENAIKYSCDDATCLIRLDWSNDDHFVEVSVSDAGIGVPLEDEAFIFNETYQAENAMRRRTQGTGIGLYQCRVIMERLGGAIAYRRLVNHPEGLVTAFVVQIPRGRFK